MIKSKQQDRNALMHERTLVSIRVQPKNSPNSSRSYFNAQQVRSWQATKTMHEDGEQVCMQLLETCFERTTRLASPLRLCAHKLHQL